MQTSAFMIGFVGLKGGTTKSTLATLVATKLWHDYPKIKLSVWDLDNQLTIYYRRLEDLTMYRFMQRVVNEPELAKTMEVKPKISQLKKQIEIFQRADSQNPMYPIRPYFSPSNNGVDPDLQYEKFVNHPNNPIEYLRITDMEESDNQSRDIILVDFPGTIEYKPDMENLLVRLNALIIPVECESNKAIDSQKQYCNVIETLLQSTECNFRDRVYIAWSRADKSLYQKKAGESAQDTVARVKNKLEQMMASAEFPFPSISAVIPESKKIKDDTLSTILPLSNDTVASEAVDIFVKELFDKVIN